MTDVDLIVVGAGLSGLIAARNVAKNGIKVRIIEARNRIGGRVFNLNDIPLGADLYDPERHFALQEEINKYGLEHEVPDVQRPYWHLTNDLNHDLLNEMEFIDRLLSNPEFTNAMEKLNEASQHLIFSNGYYQPESNFHDISFAQFLENVMEVTDVHIREYILMRCFQLTGSNPELQSTLAILNIIRGFGSAEIAFKKHLSRLKNGGMTLLLDNIAAEFMSYGGSIEFANAVVSVVAKEEPADHKKEYDIPERGNHPKTVLHALLASGETITAQGLILAIPLACIPSIMFVPALPIELHHAAMQCDVGELCLAAGVASGISRNIDSLSSWSSACKRTIKYPLEVFFPNGEVRIPHYHDGLLSSREGIPDSTIYRTGTGSHIHSPAVQSPLLLSPTAGGNMNFMAPSSPFGAMGSTLTPHGMTSGGGGGSSSNHGGHRFSFSELQQQLRAISEDHHLHARDNNILHPMSISEDFSDVGIASSSKRHSASTKSKKRKKRHKQHKRRENTGDESDDSNADIEIKNEHTPAIESTKPPRTKYVFMIHGLRGQITTLVPEDSSNIAQGDGKHKSIDKNNDKNNRISDNSKHNSRTTSGHDAPSKLSLLNQDGNTNFSTPRSSTTDMAILEASHIPRTTPRRQHNNASPHSINTKNYTDSVPRSASPKMNHGNDSTGDISTTSFAPPTPHGASSHHHRLHHSPSRRHHENNGLSYKQSHLAHDSNPTLRHQKSFNFLACNAIRALHPTIEFHKFSDILPVFVPPTLDAQQRKSFLNSLRNVHNIEISSVLPTPRRNSRRLSSGTAAENNVFMDGQDGMASSSAYERRNSIIAMSPSIGLLDRSSSRRILTLHTESRESFDEEGNNYSNATPKSLQKEYSHKHMLTNDSFLTSNLHSYGGVMKNHNNNVVKAATGGRSITSFTVESLHILLGAVIAQNYDGPNSHFGAATYQGSMCPGCVSSMLEEFHALATASIEAKAALVRHTYDRIKGRNHSMRNNNGGVSISPLMSPSASTAGVSSFFGGPAALAATSGSYRHKGLHISSHDHHMMLSHQLSGIPVENFHTDSSSTRTGSGMLPLLEEKRGSSHSHGHHHLHHHHSRRHKSSQWSGKQQSSSTTVVSPAPMLGSPYTLQYHRMKSNGNLMRGTSNTNLDTNNHNTTPGNLMSADDLNCGSPTPPSGELSRFNSGVSVGLGESINSTATPVGNNTSNDLSNSSPSTTGHKKGLSDTFPRPSHLYIQEPNAHNNEEINGNAKHDFDFTHGTPKVTPSSKNDRGVQSDSSIKHHSNATTRVSSRREHKNSTPTIAESMGASFVCFHDFVSDPFSRSSWFALRAGTGILHSQACAIAKQPWGYTTAGTRLILPRKEGTDRPSDVGAIWNSSGSSASKLINYPRMVELCGHPVHLGTHDALTATAFFEADAATSVVMRHTTGASVPYIYRDVLDDAVCLHASNAIEDNDFLTHNSHTSFALTGRDRREVHYQRQSIQLIGTNTNTGQVKIEIGAKMENSGTTKSHQYLNDKLGYQQRGIEKHNNNTIQAQTIDLNSSMNSITGPISSSKRYIMDPETGKFQRTTSPIRNIDSPNAHSSPVRNFSSPAPGTSTHKQTMNQPNSTHQYNNTTVVPKDSHNDLPSRKESNATEEDSQPLKEEELLVAQDRARALIITGSDVFPAWTGWLEGAVLSGTDAAERMCRYLRPQPKARNFTRSKPLSQEMMDKLYPELSTTANKRRIQKEKIQHAPQHANEEKSSHANLLASISRDLDKELYRD